MKLVTLICLASVLLAIDASSSKASSGSSGSSGSSSASSSPTSPGSAASPSTTASAPVKPLPISNATANGLSSFALELYETVVPGRLRNVLLSPLSVSTCLTLLWLGARGKTAEVLQDSLKFAGESQVQLTNDFQQILKPQQKSNSYVIANAIYAASNLQVATNFQSLATNAFYSMVDAINFKNNTQAANTINEWIGSKTHGQITDMVAPSDVGSDTEMILVNAIYFNQSWANPFSEVDTHFGNWNPTCTPSSSDQTGYALMRNVGRYFFAEIPELNATALRLDFNNSDVAMTILLPNQCGGLEALEAAMKGINLLSLQSRLKPQNLMIFIPKFEFDYNINLNYVLSQMGMKDIYSHNADFSGLFASKIPVSVSDVQTKATIAVSERGAVATSATYSRISFHKGLPRVPRFMVDHPFVFYLHTPQEVIFIGRLWQPTIMKWLKFR